MKNLFIICALSLVCFSIISCSSTETKKEVSTEVTTVKTDTVAVYECPMKCEGKTYDKAGQCPVCGMDLEKVD